MQRHKQLVSPEFQIFCQIILTNKHGYNVNGGHGRDQTQLPLKGGGFSNSKICLVLLGTILGLNILRWS